MKLLEFFVPLFIILPILSTSLNILQTLNGTTCFSMDKNSETSFRDTRVVSIFEQNDGYEILGFKNSSLDHMCYSESPSYPSNCDNHLGYIKCKNVMVEKDKVYYNSELTCSCYRRGKGETEKFTGFSIHVIKGEFLISGFETNGRQNPGSYECWFKTETKTCKLSNVFYYYFTIFSVTMIVLGYLIKIAFIFIPFDRFGVLSVLTVWLSNKGLIRYCNWFSNKPYHLVPGSYIVVLSERNKQKLPENLSPIVKNTNDGFIKLHFYRNNMFLMIDTNNVLENIKIMVTKEQYTNVRYCIENVIEHTPIVESVNSCHFVSVNEMLKLIKEGCIPFKFQLGENQFNVLYGKMVEISLKEISNSLRSQIPVNFGVDTIHFLIKHNQTFFKSLRLSELILACKGQYICTDEVKNSEWKIYISDVNKHILKNKLKIKKYGKSKSLIKCENDKEYMDNLVKLETYIEPIEIPNIEEYTEPPEEANTVNGEWLGVQTFNENFMYLINGLCITKEVDLFIKPKIKNNYDEISWSNEEFEYSNYIKSKYEQGDNYVSISSTEVLNDINQTFKCVKLAVKVWVDKDIIKEKQLKKEMYFSDKLKCRISSGVKMIDDVKDNPRYHICCDKSNVAVKDGFDIAIVDVLLSPITKIVKAANEVSSVCEFNEKLLDRMTTGKYKRRPNIKNKIFSVPQYNFKNYEEDVFPGSKVSNEIKEYEFKNLDKLVTSLQKMKLKNNLLFIKEYDIIKLDGRVKFKNFNDFYENEVTENTPFPYQSRNNTKFVGRRMNNKIIKRGFYFFQNKKYEGKIKKEIPKTLNKFIMNSVKNETMEQVKLFLTKNLNKKNKLSQNKKFVKIQNVEYSFKELGITKKFRKCFVNDTIEKYMDFLDKFKIKKGKEKEKDKGECECLCSSVLKILRKKDNNIEDFSGCINWILENSNNSNKPIYTRMEEIYNENIEKFEIMVKRNEEIVKEIKDNFC